MATVDTGDASKRELIQSALEALGPIDDEITRWVTKRVIIRIARDVRDAYHKNKRSVSRLDLRDRLETIADTANQLGDALVGPGAVPALTGTWWAKNETKEIKEQFAAFDNLQATLDELPRSLDNLKFLAMAAITELGLKGRRGPVTAWHRLRPSAKVLLAIHGLPVFARMRDGIGWANPSGQKYCQWSSEPEDQGYQLPDPKNKSLNDFLALVWAAAAGESDVLDWTTSLRVARGQRVPKGTDAAIAIACIDHFVLMDDAKRWELGRRKSKIRE